MYEMVTDVWNCHHARNGRRMQHVHLMQHNISVLPQQIKTLRVKESKKSTDTAISVGYDKINHSYYICLHIVSDSEVKE